MGLKPTTTGITIHIGKQAPARACSPFVEIKRHFAVASRLALIPRIATAYWYLRLR